MITYGINSIVTSLKSRFTCGLHAGGIYIPVEIMRDRLVLRLPIVEKSKGYKVRAEIWTALSNLNPDSDAEIDDCDCLKPQEKSKAVIGGPLPISIWVLLALIVGRNAMLIPENVLHHLDPGAYKILAIYHHYPLPQPADAAAAGQLGSAFSFHTCSYRVDIYLDRALEEVLLQPLDDDPQGASKFDVLIHSQLLDPNFTGPPFGSTTRGHRALCWDPSPTSSHEPAKDQTAATRADSPLWKFRARIRTRKAASLRHGFSLSGEYEGHPVIVDNAFGPINSAESRATSVDRDSIYVDDSDGDGDYEDLALNPFVIGFTDNLNEQRVFLDQLNADTRAYPCERIEMLIAEIHRLQGTAAVSFSPDLLAEEPTQGTPAGLPIRNDIPVPTVALPIVDSHPSRHG
ncbi:hypothetical protein B0H14DRAFT_2600539 [Mycena olivaceomarginata]|nr:hypothetical protein B0H14DRAFT_2600539 [Mycena olivaceomarginata]